MFKLLISALFILLMGNAHAFTDEQEGFEVSFGPWNTVDKEDRTRMVYLELMGKTIHYCYESRSKSGSDIISSCEFIKASKENGWELDKEIATTILYHNSGMNRDGSARYFWHEWLGIN